MVGSMSTRLKELRQQILDLVAEFQKERSRDNAFVPGEDIVRYAGRVFGPEELVSATDAVLDFWLTAGRFSEELEQRLAEWVGVEYAFLVNSGSSANLMAVSTLTSPQLGDRQLKPGDEVITVAAGFPTTVAPIIQNRLIPVFVDIDLGTYNAIPEQIAEAVGPRTRAIMLAHTLGNPWDLGTIMDVAEQHGLFVIEDNCDALGSLYDGKKTGAFGHLSTCSFYPAHHMTLGEGGAVLTDDDDLARIVRSFRDWGRDCYCTGGENNTCGRRFSQKFGKLPLGYDHKYVYSHIGYNLKVTDIQAAIGCAQLDRLDIFGQARRNNHTFLSERLQRHSESLILPRATARSEPSWFAFTLSVKPDAGFTRNDLTGYLEENKVETRNLFSGNLLRHPAFLDIKHRVIGNLENTEKATTDTFFVGVYPGLDSERLGYVTSVFDRYFKGR